MAAPKFFFIGRKALAEHPERVKEALRITPVEAAFATSDLDAKLAVGVAEQVVGFHRPLAIVADFPFDLSYVDEQGHLVPSELPVLDCTYCNYNVKGGQCDPSTCPVHKS